MEDVKRLIEQGDTIAAIKAYRRIHGVGLADAKAAVEAMRTKGPEPALSSPKEPD
jgi:ribosomal protein L7/L12